MRDDAEIIPGNREAKFLLQIALALIGGLAIIMLRGADSPIAVAIVHVLPPTMAVTLWPALGLARQGMGSAPFWAVVLGIAFVFGGATFDMLATYLHTPDLAIEENPVARTLLDSGHSLSFVLGYAIVAQALLALLTCILWTGLLRHREFLAGSLRGIESPLVFFKAATGGGELGWRAWIFPGRPSELPQSYHAAWVLTAILIAGSAYRWYLGLEWFGLAPRSRVVVPLVSLLGGLVAYLAWLWLASRTPVASPIDV